MIDKVLGMDQTPASRRRRNDATSETSSVNENTPKNQFARISRSSLNQNDSSLRKKNQENETSMGGLDSSIRSKPKSYRPAPPADNSGEEIHSPAVRNLKMARPAKTIEEVMMKSSNHQLSESRKSSIKLQPVQNTNEEWGYKIKVIVFLVFSLLLIYNAMIPSRKAPYKKK